MPAKDSSRQATYTNDTGSELIKITEQDGKKAVNARDLHAFLESKHDFSTWIKFRIQQYEFVENEDYAVLQYDYLGNLLNDRLHKKMESDNQKVARIEYVLTLNMAKELSMVEGIVKGKEARRYIIACEEAATGNAQTATLPAGISDRLKAIETKIDAALSMQTMQAKQPPAITVQKDILTLQEASTYTGLAMGTLYKMTCTKRIPFYKTKNGKRIYIKLVELIKWMSAIRIKPEDEVISDAAG